MSGLTLEDTVEILRCEVGSTIHGLEVEGTDDRDEIGVCIEPQEYVVGLRRIEQVTPGGVRWRTFEQFVQRDRPEGVRSQPGDLDLVVYSLRKFCRLALRGNPSVLLLFNVPDDRCPILADLGRDLRSLAPAFASKNAGSAFLGYMEAQRQRLAGERGQRNVKRPELVERYGFDTKYAGHVLRLGFQGVEYVRSGRFTVPMLEPYRELILAVRTGQVSEAEVLTRAAALEEQLREAITSSPLPDEPDYARVDAFLVSAYSRVWTADRG